MNDKSSRDILSAEIEQTEDWQMCHRVNVFFGKEDKQTSFVVQQGEYNSRKIIAKLWQRLPDGTTIAVDLAKCYVMVVFQYCAVTTPEYPTTLISGQEVGFVLPQCTLASPGIVNMQLRLYQVSSLINSAVVPFKVLRSLSPSSAPKEDEIEPGLLGVLCQVREVLTEATQAENARKEAENQRVQIWKEWEKKIDSLNVSGQEICVANNRDNFPLIGNEMVLYLAREEKNLYQWNNALMRYEQLLGDGEGTIEINVIDGGDANGVY